MKDKKQLMIVCVSIFAVLSLLLTRFYTLQVVENAKWNQIANGQHYFCVREPFLRGTFFSNTSLRPHHPEDPQRLVVEVRKVHLYVDPESIPEAYKKEIAHQLIACVDVSDDEKDRFSDQFHARSRSRKLKMWMDPHQQQDVLDWWFPYAKEHNIAKNALFFVPDYQRSYPFGKLLGQVLHTVQKQRDELTKQASPTGGLELYFDELLSGQLGLRRLMRSPINALETGEVLSEPEHGADIYLTINHTLQVIAEEEIEKGVKWSKAKNGWAVMMQPQTGEILALAQYPFFDPADYSNYYNHTHLIEHAAIKAISDAEEPGSSFKPITVAIALLANHELNQRGEKELFHPEEKIATSNGKFPGRSKPISDTGHHKYLNMYMGLQKSSNIYLGRIVERVIKKFGDGWYRNALCQHFGLGEKTGIELPAESAGLVPRPGKLHPNGTLEWSVPTPYSLAMGHNLQLNSIQFLRAMSVLANGGYLVQPTLVRKIVKGDGVCLLDHTLPSRRESFPRTLPIEVVQEVVKTMKYDTKKGGTARRGDVWGYTEVGKTGTAEKVIRGSYSKNQHSSNFIGFTPVIDPAFVLLVVIDEPEHKFIPGVGGNHYGGMCAAPVFREIARRSLEYLGVPPDDPFGYPIGDPRHDPEKGDWLVEVKQLQEKYEKWNK